MKKQPIEFLLILGMSMCSVAFADVSVFPFPQDDDATARIQRAIDDCFRAGGGMVRVAKGEYNVKSLRLRSNVTLYLESGVCLRASRNPLDYDGVVLGDADRKSVV